MFLLYDFLTCISNFWDYLACGRADGLKSIMRFSAIKLCECGYMNLCMLYLRKTGCCIIKDSSILAYLQSLEVMKDFNRNNDISMFKVQISAYTMIKSNI